MAIDPGVRNCGIVVLKNNIPVYFTAFLNYKGSIFERSMAIANVLQNIALKWQISIFGTEEFYTGGHKSIARSSANYGRGVFDGIINIAMATYPKYAVHPSHLKKWTCGNGAAKKELAEEAASKKTKERYPEFYDELTSKYPMNGLSHVLDALYIGLITYYMYQSRYLSLDIPSDEKYLLRSFEKKGKVITPAFTSQFTKIPIKH